MNYWYYGIPILIMNWYYIHTNISSIHNTLFSLRWLQSEADRNPVPFPSMPGALGTPHFLWQTCYNLYFFLFPRGIRYEQESSSRGGTHWRRVARGYVRFLCLCSQYKAQQCCNVIILTESVTFIDYYGLPIQKYRHRHCIVNLHNCSQQKEVLGCFHVVILFYN